MTIGTQLNIDNLADDLICLIRSEFNLDYVAKFATVESFVNCDGGGISICSLDESHANLSVVCQNGNEIAYITIGANTVLEVPVSGGRYTGFEGVDELLSILRSVIMVGFEERIWFIRESIVKSEATLIPFGEKKPIIVTNSSLYNPLVRKTLVIKKYQPYY